MNTLAVIYDYPNPACKCAGSFIELRRIGTRRGCAITIWILSRDFIVWIWTPESPFSTSGVFFFFYNCRSRKTTLFRFIISLKSFLTNCLLITITHVPEQCCRCIKRSSIFHRAISTGKKKRKNETTKKSNNNTRAFFLIYIYIYVEKGRRTITLCNMCARTYFALSTCTFV